MLDIPVKKFVTEVFLEKLYIRFYSRGIGIFIRRIDSIAVAQGYKTGKIVIFFSKAKCRVCMPASP